MTVIDIFDDVIDVRCEELLSSLWTIVMMMSHKKSHVESRVEMKCFIVINEVRVVEIRIDLIDRKMKMCSKCI